MSDFKINISTLKSGAAEKMELDVNGVVAKDGFGAEVRVFGAIERNGADYRLKGSVKGNVAAVCARCLDNVSIPYEAEIDFSFQISGSGSEVVLQLDGSNIDIGDVIAGTIRADIPISVLCSEDCKGLCQVCGCDLNKVSCACRASLANPVIDLSKFNWNNE